MIPLYEQGDGRGIGHSSESFIHRFDEICQAHLASGRAKSFAFIFYDFRNKELRRVLKDEGVFTELDRLSGSELSIFFLHAASEKGLRKFNQTFLKRLGVDGDGRLPCVVFFSLANGRLENLKIVSLESPNLIHGFRELHKIVEDHLQEPKSGQAPSSRKRGLILEGGRFIAIETFRGALRELFRAVF